MLLLDTNIVSFFFREHRLAKKYFPLILGRDTAISFQTVEEMKEGSLLAEWSLEKHAKLHTHLVQYTVFHSDEEICSWCAWIRAIRRSNTISMDDAWIAATAMSYDLELVTHNPKDFQDIPGLRIITAIR